MSRSYYYELRQPAEQLLDKLYAAGDIAAVILVTQNYIERCVVALSFYCRSSLEGIVSFFDNVLGYHMSKGRAYNILKKAQQNAAQFDASVSLTSIQEIASDEIFQQQQPILTVVDLRTRYIVMMEPTKDRTGETWHEELDKCKEQGLSPSLNVSDAGSGLLKGIPEAYPEIAMQLDVFHSLREIGREISKIERSALSGLSDLYELEQRINSKKVHQKTIERYNRLIAEIPPCLQRYDTLDVLFSWLKEYVGFSGYGYAKSLEVCNWILEEMTMLYPQRKKFLDAIEKFGKHLPRLLRFLLRLQDNMSKIASDYHVDQHAFMLMYNQTAYPAQSAEYEFMEKKLYRLFGKRLPDARLALSRLVETTYRASSIVENVNGCTRDFIELKRTIPEGFFVLLKVFFNTKKSLRSRNKGWKFTSALDRLTGTMNPEFLDIVIGQRDFAA